MEQQNQQPIQEKTESKPPIKINPKLIIVIIGALTLVVGGVILLVPFSCFNSIEDECGWFSSVETMPSTIHQTPSPAPQPQTLDISTWQTYRNDEFGFEVRYPSGWSIIGEATNEPAFSPDGKVKIYTRLHVNGTTEYIHSLAYRDEQECPERIFEPGEPIIAPGAACPVVKTKETKEININGIKGYLKERESGSLSAYLPRSDKKIAIELTAIHPDYKDVFNQILSTFRFVGKVTPADKQSCEAKGGTWGRFGLAQVELCNLPTSDANKTCTDSSQCESVCVADDNTLPDAKTTGKCYGWTETLGTCLNYVNNGKAQGTLCAD